MSRSVIFSAVARTGDRPWSGPGAAPGNRPGSTGPALPSGGRFRRVRRAMSPPLPGLGLLGRRRERAALDGLIEAVRAGESRALVVRGEAGVGKSALLEYVTERARGCRIVRVLAVETEMELAFAALHQLCAPLLDRLERLPVPQRDALA